MDKVIHFEIPFDNSQRAQKFYKEIFGWQINILPEMDYYMVNTVETDPNTMIPKEPGAINGGMLQRDPSGPNPVIVIGVNPIDDYLTKIEKAGGKVVMPKIAIGKFGFYARVSDTEGNIIGLWQTLKP